MIRRLISVIWFVSADSIGLPKLARSPMTKILSARAPVIDSLSERHHFFEPVIAGAHGEFERVARFPNCFTFNKHKPAEFWLFRLRRMVDAAPEAAVYDETALAVRIHATPSPRAGTVAASALRFSPAKDAHGVAYCGSNTISRRTEGRTTRSRDVLGTLADHVPAR
jgi:hypothetical protein